MFYRIFRKVRIQFVQTAREGVDQPVQRCPPDIGEGSATGRTEDKHETDAVLSKPWFRIIGTHSLGNEQRPVNGADTA